VVTAMYLKKVILELTKYIIRMFHTLRKNSR